MLNITKNNFDEEVISSDIPVVIDFTATWCGPCRMLTPVLQALSVEYRDKVRFCKVNIDDEPELAARFGVAAVPTLVFLKYGELRETAVGYREKDQIIDIIDSLK